MRQVTFAFARIAAAITERAHIKFERSEKGWLFEGEGLIGVIAVLAVIFILGKMIS